MTTVPACGIMVCIYLCMYQLPHVCRTLIPEICMYALKCSVYSGILTCVVYNCRLIEQQGRLELLVSAMKIIDEENAQTHGINRFSLLRQCMELYLPGNLPTHLCESRTTDELTLLQFCADVHVNKGTTLNLLVSACHL